MKDRIFTRIWGLVISLICIFILQGQSGPNPAPGTGVDRPLGSGLEYNRLKGSAGELQSFSIPIVLPLEARLGDLNLGGRVDYVRKEFHSESGDESVEGAGYFSLDSRYLAISSTRFRLELSERVNVPLARNKNEDLPREAWLNTGGYILDSAVSFSYYLSRVQLQLGLEHNWRLSRDEYDPGESLRTSFILGYGLGSGHSLDDRYPWNVTLGITSHYRYYDRVNQERVTGTQYGTVFFAPGLNYYTSSLNLWANIEVPIHHIQAEDEAYREGIRGNIGLKYYLR